MHVYGSMDFSQCIGCHIRFPLHWSLPSFLASFFLTNMHTSHLFNLSQAFLLFSTKVTNKSCCCVLLSKFTPFCLRDPGPNVSCTDSLSFSHHRLSVHDEELVSTVELVDRHQFTGRRRVHELVGQVHLTLLLVSSALRLGL